MEQLKQYFCVPKGFDTFEEQFWPLKNIPRSELKVSNLVNIQLVVTLYVLTCIKKTTDIESKAHVVFEHLNVNQLGEGW